MLPVSLEVSNGKRANKEVSLPCFSLPKWLEDVDHWCLYPLFKVSHCFGLSEAGDIFLHAWLAVKRLNVSNMAH